MIHGMVNCMFLHEDVMLLINNLEKYVLRLVKLEYV